MITSFNAFGHILLNIWPQIINHPLAPHAITQSTLHNFHHRISSCGEKIRVKSLVEFLNSFGKIAEETARRLNARPTAQKHWKTKSTVGQPPSRLTQEFCTRVAQKQFELAIDLRSTNSMKPDDHPVDRESIFYAIQVGFRFLF